MRKRILQVSMTRQASSHSSRLNRVMRFASIGIALPATIWLAYQIGQWLDTRAHTTYWAPTLTILGFLAALLGIYREIQRFNTDPA